MSATFSINNTPTYPFNASSGNSSGAITTSTTTANQPLGVPGDTVLLSNVATDWCFVTFSKGNGTITKPTPGIPKAGVIAVPPQSVMSVSLVAGADGRIASPVDTINALANSGTGTLYFTVGSGT